LLQMGDPDATIDRQPADEPTVVEPEQSEPVTVRAGGSIVPQPNETAVPRSSGQGPLSLVAGTDEPTSRGSANPPPAAAPAGQESDVAPIPAPATSPTPPTATPPTVTPPTLAVPPVAGPKTNAEANASRQANRAAERAASKSRKDDQKDARKAATKGSKGSSKNRNKGNGGLGGN
jgi:hypothetical protein